MSAANYFYVYKTLKEQVWSTSLQIISKENGQSKELKTIGYATRWRAIEKLESFAREEIEKMTSPQKLFEFSLNEPLKIIF